MTQLPPLVSRHDTWVSVDPIIGCPADCTYCYLRPLSLTRLAPKIRSNVAEVTGAIAAHLESAGRSWGRPASPVPICIGNYTDVFMSADVVAFLAELGPEIGRCFPNHPIVFVTKSPLACQAIEVLRRSSSPTILFLSQSFVCESSVPEIENGKTASVAITLAAARKAREAGIIPVHFWRPFSPVLNPADSLSERIRMVRDAGFSSSVLVGFKSRGTALKSNPAVQGLLTRTRPVEYGEAVDPQLIQTAFEEGDRLKHPMYRHTSCAIANALGMPESLGTWRPGLGDEYCAPCSCPTIQRASCARLRLRGEVPEPELLERLKTQTGAKRIAWDPGHSLIRLACDLPQDQVCELSHATGFRIEPDRVFVTRAWRGSM